MGSAVKHSAILGGFSAGTGKENLSATPDGQTNTIRPGQQVKIEGRAETYVVLRVDKSRHLADLLGQGSVRKVETGIPLALLCVVAEPGSTDNLQLSEAQTVTIVR